MVMLKIINKKNVHVFCTNTFYVLETNLLKIKKRKQNE